MPTARGCFHFLPYPPVNWRAIVRGPSGTGFGGGASLGKVLRRFAVAIHLLRFFLRFVAFGIIFVYAGLDGYCWGIGERWIQQVPGFAVFF